MVNLEKKNIYIYIMQFRIIKLTNNDDPKEFTLEITRMRDIRQRIGIILYNRKRGRTGRACGRQRWLDRSGRSGQGVRVVG